VRLADPLDAAEAVVLAYLVCPREDWRQIWSTNPLERPSKEIKRRTNVVRIFSTRPQLPDWSAPFSPSSTTSGR
jgi:transposase-like protein